MGALLVLVVGTLVACGGTAPTSTPEPSLEVDGVVTIPAGEARNWDVSDYNSCTYHFIVEQTGSLGSVDIGFQGERYKEKDGAFYGTRFTLDNGYSLRTAKVVDLRLRCQ